MQESANFDKLSIGNFMDNNSSDHNNLSADVNNSSNINLEDN